MLSYLAKKVKSSLHYLSELHAQIILGKACFLKGV